MARCGIARGIGLIPRSPDVRWHRPERTVGLMLAVAYITMFLGSVLGGVVYHAGRPEGIVLGYLIALVIAVLIVPLFNSGPGTPQE